MNIMLALILIVLEASVLSSPLQNEYNRNIFIPKGKPDITASYRIVGGVEVTPHSLPYQAGLIANNRFICGGVIISTKHVLTAAHCVYGMEGITVVLGAHEIFNSEDTQVIIYNPTVIIHANYSENLRNDIALLKLPQHVPPTIAIKAIPLLASQNSGNFVGFVGRISGWGAISADGYVQFKLRKAYVEIISNQRCHIQSRGAIPNSNMCTLGTDELIGPIGGCNGDSGGPLVVGDELVGLISYGSTECDAGIPTAYTRISYFREWITVHSGV